MGINFEMLEEVKVEKNKVNNCPGTNYVLAIIVHRLQAVDIDFDSFTYEDICNVESSLDSLITDEDMEGNVSLDPSHPFMQIWSLGNKVDALWKVAKLQQSPFPFI